MSQGLVATKDDVICLAADSKGTSPAEVAKKVFLLQSSPEVKIVVTGGMQHWAKLGARYLLAKGDVKAAADEVTRLLKECTEEGSDAHGLVCGFHQGQAQCYRVGKLPDLPVSDTGKNEFDQGRRVVGIGIDGPQAAHDADALLGTRGLPAALIETIDLYASKRPEIVRPIYVEFIRRTVPVVGREASAPAT